MPTKNKLHRVLPAVANVFDTTTPNKVYYEHLRNIDERGEFETRGGSTIAWRFDENTLDTDEPVFEMGVAVCNETDNFCKKRGRVLAEERLNSTEDRRTQSKWSARYTIPEYITKDPTMPKLISCVRLSGIALIKAIMAKHRAPKKRSVFVPAVVTPVVMEERLKLRRELMAVMRSERRVTKSHCEVK